MVEEKHQTKDTAAVVMDEIVSKIQQFDEDSIQSFDRQRFLAQKRQILVNAYGKTSSGMTQLIMNDMISEIDQEIAHLDENTRLCHQHKDYYIEILRVVRESVEELKLVK